MLSIIAVISCFLVTTALSHENTTTQGIKISIDCSRQQGHVDLTVPACLPPLATPTGPGYEWFPGLGHYKFHPYGASWHQAQQHCVDEGTHLIVLNSRREARVVTTLFTRNPTMPGAEQTGWAWTGVHEQGGNGKYVTLTGDPLNSTGFNFWSPNEPNDGGTDDCVLTHRANALLADAACSRVFAFICELEL